MVAATWITVVILELGRKAAHVLVRVPASDVRCVRFDFRCPLAFGLLVLPRFSIEWKPSAGWVGAAAGAASGQGTTQAK